MKYKAVICDLDGTLLNSDHTISEFTKNIISKVKSKGIKFFIATGRHYQDAKVFKDMLELDSFMITSNGAKVHDENSFEIISNNIPSDLSDEIIDITLSKEIHKNLYQDDFWYAEKPLHDGEEFHKESGFTHVLKPFEELKGKDVTKFFYICEDEEKIRDLEEEFMTKFKGKLNVTLSLGTCLEIMNRGISKATAIQQVLEKEGLTMENAIAFGDGLNDYEMLKGVGKGLIMGNGNYRLMEALPDNEVIDTNDEDGVAKYLSALFL
ncbi:MAG: Cof-type HAD-IIB family hydrolase [Cetobacterium sp.]|uniref:Cof-type HAD-IIB family hydrolase n=1 Tax=unclassified Cetobacterium TaxID=2630983 RepID=UPI00163C2864|nr:Cof-type HAD-IIB family hydrolase [Cetobacterium sp. 2A]MBC2855725.1 Cof-type HAD-IIB family hydrolase [Cetobacterium sp. 2A]